MKLVSVRNATSRGAVCNDGSAAKYYVRPGSGSGASRWVIFLQGGGWCNSVADCNQRRLEDPQLMTSNSAPTTHNPGGILSQNATNNPDFYNANQVYMKYCSSDRWHGDRVASTGTGGYHFRGRRIVQAVIDDLKTGVSGMPALASASEVIFSGASAGGYGARYNLDNVSDALPQADVVGYIDASIPNDYMPPGVTQAGMISSRMSQDKLYGASLRPECVSALSNSGQNTNLCYLDHIDVQYMRTPAFYQNSLLDRARLNPFLAWASTDAERQQITSGFRAAVIKACQDMEASYCPDSTKHIMLTNDFFFSYEIDGWLPREVFGNWYFDREGPIQVIEN